MHVHSPKAETAHVKWFLPQEHSALALAPGEREREGERERKRERETEVSAAHRHQDEETGDQDDPRSEGP